MNRKELNDILKNHKKWLDGEEGGVCADLSGANLSSADLRYSDLRDADLRYSDLRDADLSSADMTGTDLSYANMRCTDMSEANMRGANMRGTDMRDADLSYADLRDANMRGTDLRGANLDYSCLPLWCGSLDANFDDRQLIQIAYHLVRAGLNSKNASDETKKELSKLIDFANKFHRVKECGRIQMTSEDVNAR